ncbi:MAG: ribonuclease HII [Candidatus Thorarchaeota archaeon]|nr:MAG: ribonuclease HII [Candidatus Thorarchaeota archaeon]
MVPRNLELHGIGGIDEAGRGPMIGPLVVCGVSVAADRLPELERIGVKDSKLLTPRRRTELALLIRGIAGQVVIRSISAADIDRQRAAGITLNEIEAVAFASVLSSLRSEHVFIDSVDVNPQRFGRVVGERSGLLSLGCSITSEHHADFKYPIVSAASIVAKVERDREIERMRKEFGDIGSGYPSDHKTVQFVRNLVAEGRELPDIVRQGWVSVKRILVEGTKNRSGSLGEI